MYLGIVEPEACTVLLDLSFQLGLASNDIHLEDSVLILNVANLIATALR